ncbi:hypothetical protein [Roseovarius nitratireducens]|uniref:hypothetical protein n=1 Tax=Roseovarius nitratireducens TaxID=2044597 RepID=UPI00197D5084|nr:hypothetical protein [Roseovarius nitratireducens]
MAHFELRVKIGNAGGVLVSPSIEFGEDSDRSSRKTCWLRSHSTSARRTVSKP